LVCCAGIGQSRAFTATAIADHQHLMAVDLAAPLTLAHALLPGMVKRGSGRIVLVSSVAGRVGVAGEATYAAAKAGLDVFAESLRLELQGSGVGVTTVLPGLVATPFLAGRANRAGRAMPRPLSAERVAEVLVRAVEKDRDEVWVPRWLRAAPMVRAAMPRTFHWLSARFGEPVRIGPAPRPKT
jgi:short-subunit dehydrogenase